MERDWDSVITQLSSMDGYRFESFVSDLWSTRGWKTTVTKQSNDSGIDVIALKSDPFSQKHLIQAKCYSSGNKVNSKEVQQYSSLKQQVEGVDAVVIVTTTGFTSQAEKLSSKLNVKLIDGDSLIELILASEDTGILEKYSINVDSNKKNHSKVSNGQIRRNQKNKVEKFYEIKNSEKEAHLTLYVKFPHESISDMGRNLRISVGRDGSLLVMNFKEGNGGRVLDWAKKNNLEVIVGGDGYADIRMKYRSFPKPAGLISDIIELLEIAYDESPEVIDTVEIEMIDDPSWLPD